jgi:DNA-binding HxlR family transcriptional regulator
MFGNRRHFRELLEYSDEGIASNILASRLKALVAGGLLTRDDALRGQRAAYSLTEAGIQTLPIMVALGSWGLAHRSGTPELRIRAELLRDGGPERSKQFMDELRETHLGTPGRGPDHPTTQGQRLRVLQGHFVLERAPDAPKLPSPADVLALIFGPDGRTAMRRNDTAEDAWVALWNGDDAHDPEATGMLSAIVAPLAAAKLPVWVTSSYDGDLILVPTGRLDEAIDTLRRAGHQVIR